jgi:DNA polymerase-3 subunit epsilon
MSAILFFDTETNGLPNFRAPNNDRAQPHIVQIAAMICNEAGNVKSTLNTLISRDGWIIGEELQAINGISNEDCDTFGIPIELALSLMMEMRNKCEVGVAHNISFDNRMLEIEASRLRRSWTGQAYSWECTAAMTTPICKMPPTPKMLAAGFDKFKMPKLIEAHQHLFGEGFDKAHDAMADVMACKRIYFECKRLAE